MYPIIETQVVGENDTHVIYCFIECGNHTFLIIWHVFDYAKFQNVNEKIWTICWYQNLKKSWGKSDSQKSDLVKHL